MNRFYNVTAVEIDTADGKLLGEPRTEKIDTVTNQLFWGAAGPWGVEDIYLTFWNRLNDSWEYQVRPEKVIVLRVEGVEGE